MAFDRFLIAPINTGLETDLKSWIIPEDAFSYLQNAYVFRGRVRKRFGSILMGMTPLSSRLRINLGNTPGPLNLPGNASQLQIGQMFSVGSDIFSVYQLGASALTLSTNAGATATINSTSNPNTVTFTGEPGGTPVYYYPANPVMGIDQYEINAINNHPTFAFDTQFAYLFSGGAWARSGTAVWHGTNYQLFWTTNWQGLAGNPVLFVTNFNATIGTPGATDDPIWSYDGTTWTAASGFNSFFFLPSGLAIGQGAYVKTARIIVAFKNRLVLLNTVENNNTLPSSLGNTDGGGGASGTVPGGTGSIGEYFIIGTSIFEVTVANGALTVIGTGTGTFNTATGAYTFTGASATSAIYFYTGLGGTNTAYVNRARFSFNGSPFARNAWYEPNQQDTSAGVVLNNNIAAGAGFIDAATEEQIVTAEFVKDRLIVYFERSVWELAYTGNEILPFIWNKLNTELGSQSTFSVIPFDKEALAIGNSGIHACNGSNVVRIDDKIPDNIFEFDTDNNNELRTVGIRDYYVETAYWAYVSDIEQSTQTFPNQVLVYNYKNNSWAINDDCFTAFGYFEQQGDTTWASSFPLKWYEANETWSSGVLQANQRQILAGTPEGFVVRINPDIARNAPSMYITNMSIASTGIVTLTIINHNLNAVAPVEYPWDSDFVLIENVVADATTMAVLNGFIFAVFTTPDANTITINTLGALTSGTYAGGGTCARVSNIQITTKRFNPYIEKANNVYIGRVDFGVEATATGEITVDYFPSSTNVSMIQGGVSTGAIMGDSILETRPYPANLYPLEQYQSLLWHSIYLQSSGNFIQLGLYFNLQQMLNPLISLSDFELEAMILYTSPVGRLQ